MSKVEKEAINPKIIDQLSGNHEQQQDSEFSLEEIKKTQRKNNKKHITKIVHTCCFVQIDSSGRKKLTYYHGTSHTSSREQKTIKSFALRFSQEHRQQVVSEFKEKLVEATDYNVKKQNNFEVQPILRFAPLIMNQSYFPF